MSFCAISAGLFAAVGASLAKGAFETGRRSVLSSVVLFAGFILCNVLMWWMHTLALRSTSSTVQVVVLNTASNFIGSGVIGLVVFGEVHGILWWFGISLLISGSVLIANAKSELEEKKRI